jgi:hypothetical protein
MVSQKPPSLWVIKEKEYQLSRFKVVKLETKDLVKPELAIG